MLLLIRLARKTSVATCLPHFLNTFLVAAKPYERKKEVAKFSAPALGQLQNQVHDMMPPQLLALKKASIITWRASFTSAFSGFQVIAPLSGVKIDIPLLVAV